MKKVSRLYTREEGIIFIFSVGYMGGKKSVNKSAIRVRKKWNFWSRLNSARERYRGAPPVRTDPGAVERAKS